VCSQRSVGASIGLLMYQLQSRKWGRRTVRFVRIALEVFMKDDGNLVDVIQLSLVYVCSCTACGNVPTHWGQLVLQTARHPYCTPPMTLPLNTLENTADVEITEQRTMEGLLTSCLQHSGTSVYMLTVHCLKRTELPSL
jgi:hypothetical protein